MLKKSNQKKMKERFDFKKFWNNWNGFDSFFGYIGGNIQMAAIWMFVAGYTVTQVIAQLRPFGQPIISLVVFAYCLNKASCAMSNRKYALKIAPGLAGIPQGFFGNLISISWILGGLIFLASNTPELWEILVGLGGK